MPDLPKSHTAIIDAPKHIGAGDRDKKNRQAKARQEKRAMPTNSTAWLRLRRKILSHEPLCRICKANGLIVPATEVDHIDNDPSTYDSNHPDNLQPLCKPCHSAKTAREQALSRH